MRTFPKGAPTALRSATTLDAALGCVRCRYRYVLLPSLSQAVARNNKKEAAALLSDNLKRALF